MAKNRFYMYLEYEVFFDGMDDHELAQLIRAIYAHEKGEDEGELSPRVDMAFRMIKNRLDNNREEYEKTLEARANAGKAGGLAKANKGKQKLANVANASKPKQPEANLADNENDNDKDNGNENENVNDNTTPLNPPKGKRETQEQIFDRLIVDQNIGPVMEEKIREWLRYKAEKRDGYKEQGMKSLLSKIMKAVYEHGETAVMDAIDTSMASGWRGLFFDRIPARGQPQDRMQQTTDMIDRWAIAREEYERRNNDTS